MIFPGFRGIGLKPPEVTDEGDQMRKGDNQTPEFAHFGEGHFHFIESRHCEIVISELRRAPIYSLRGQKRTLEKFIF